MVKLIIICLLVFALILSGIVWVLNVNSVDKESLEEAIYDEYAVLTGYARENTNSLIKTLYDGFEVEVMSASEKEGTITAQCSFSNYDVAAAFYSLSGNTEMTYADYMQELTKAVQSQDKLQHETTVAVVVEVDVGYNVSFTDAQLDMAMGGFLSYYQTQYGTEAEG